MANKVNIVHEAEAQRQFVRIQLPLKVKIGGQVYETIDWSNGGVALEWPESMNKDQSSVFVEGKILKGNLDFPFEEFDMALAVDMEIRYVDRERRRIGCRFTNLSTQQISMLQYFVGAYISGEVIRVGDVLEVAARNNFTTQRKIPVTEADGSGSARLLRSMKRRTGMMGVMLASLALAAYVIGGLYERAYVVNAKSASVSADLVKVQATAGGTVFYQSIEAGSRVQKGKPLVMISTDTGSMVSLDSPCDCLIISRSYANYDRVKMFDSVISLVPTDAKPFVTATVSYDEAVKLTRGQSVQLEFLGKGNRIGGQVENVMMNSGEESSTARVLIKPEIELPVEFVGNPVAVKIDTF
jgi:alginate biosynthesis protein Alg44